MGGARRGHCDAVGLRWLGTVLAVVLSLGCKCARPKADEPLLPHAPASATASARPEPPLSIEPTFVELNRARRFADAKRALERLGTRHANEPPYRFVTAYLALRNGDGQSATELLAGLGPNLPSLAPEIDRLAAEARLGTLDALSGAEWLEAHGRKEAWLHAARHLWRLERADAALAAITRGLAGAGGRSNALMADLRTLRVEIYDQQGQRERALEDLRWLAREAPTHTLSRARVAEALDRASIGLEPAQSLERLRRLADAGLVERVEVELTRLGSKHPRLITPAVGAFLKGRVRQIARVEQLAGAKWLERAADLKHENASQLRVDAARLYVREGDLDHAVRAYDRVAFSDSKRADEAAFYAARACAILGDPRRGSARYTQFIERRGSAALRKQAEVERALFWMATGDMGRAEPELVRLSELATLREKRPLLLELAGVSAWLLGKREIAAERFSKVKELGPLSLAGTFAQARLERLPAALSPALLEEAPAQESLTTSRPEVAAPPTSSPALDVSPLHAGVPPPNANAPASLGTGLLPAVPPPNANAPVSLGTTLLPEVPSSPAPVTMEAPISLPRRTNQLLAFGLDELAALALTEELPKANPLENSCRSWGKVAWGERGYRLSSSLRDAVDLSSLPTPENRWKWECRFPRPYRAMVSEFESAYRLPRDLLYAVMRQESGFDPDIVSPVGAVGLLQLMPQTARQIAKEVEAGDDPRLEEPRINLELGAAYLRKLLDVFDQNLVLTIAAYNAGPQAVALWLRHSGSSSVELFAARIPYVETQRYVERVLSNLLVYRALAGEPLDFAGVSLELPKELKVSGQLY